MRRRRTIGLLFCACSTAPQGAPADAADSPPFASIEAIERQGAEKVTVSVTFAGAEPRRTLQYAGTGAERRGRFSWQMWMTGDEPQLAMGLDIDVRWTPRSAGEWAFAVDGVRGLDGSPDHPMSDDEKTVQRAIHDTIGRVGGRARMHEGSRLELAQTRGMTTQPSIAMLLYLFSIPLPAEPLGLGARWTVTDADDSREFEIVALTGERASVKIGAVLRPKVPPGSQVPASVETITGLAELEFTDPLARAGEITFTTRWLDDPAGMPAQELRLSFAPAP